MKSQFERYLARLRHELRQRGVVDERIVEEAHGHLTDALERRVEDGMSHEAAEREAIARFGTPELVASNVATARFRVRHRQLLAAAVILGLAAAYVDSRPTWDDTGITAFSMLMMAAVLGFLGPQRPWLWALAIGIWIPLGALAQTASLGAISMFVVLAFPLAGAYAGMAVRRVLHPAGEDGPSGFHERQFSFGVRTKRGWVDPTLLAIASDPDTQLVPYLRRVAPPPLGPLGEIDSVTLVEESPRLRTYRAVFGKESKVVCTIGLAPDGRAVSVDWLRLS